LKAVPEPALTREFTDSSFAPPVRGFLHTPARKNGQGIVLSHGAGANCRSPLLTATARVFADAGFSVLRCDLPFRQQRPHGPPSPAGAANDREGLRQALMALKTADPTLERMFLGGHSYGGRQASILAAEQPQLTAGLLLLSYPLHPPRKQAELRTAHFPGLTTAALFVHGSRDPFGSLEKMRMALGLIPAKNLLMEVPGAGHDLRVKGAEADVSGKILEAFLRFFP
jgi:predicted alpha/beta-hydrolase family hydrolase